MAQGPQHGGIGSIVVVDPVSTGANVAYEASLRGYAVIALWTFELPHAFRSHLPASVAARLRFACEVDERPALAETVAALREAAGGGELVAVICGCESGVKVADRVSEALGLRTNGSARSECRRNKKLQQEAVRDAGLPSCREAGGKAWEEVADFVATEQMPVIVKPVESAGSDGVKLCRSADEAREHFLRLAGEQRKFGQQGAGILVQQFLRGKEYVVDSVSRDGEHKCVMVWLYDKRPLNGAPFVRRGRGGTPRTPACAARRRSRAPPAHPPVVRPIGLLQHGADPHRHDTNRAAAFRGALS